MIMTQLEKERKMREIHAMYDPQIEGVQDRLSEIKQKQAQLRSAEIETLKLLRQYRRQLQVELDEVRNQPVERGVWRDVSELWRKFHKETKSADTEE